MWELALSLNIRGHAERYFARYDDSINSFIEYLEISQKINDDYGTSAAMSFLAIAYLEKGDYIRAEEWNSKSLSISEGKNILYSICFGNIHRGYLYIETGRLKESICCLEKAKELYEANTFLKDWTVFLYHHLVDAYIEDFKTKTNKLIPIENKKYVKVIKRTCKNALKYIKPWPNHYGAALRVTAKYYALIGNQKKAEKFFKKSIEQLKPIKRWYELGRTYYEYGVFLESTNRKEEAKKTQKQAYALFKNIGSKHYIQKLTNR